MVNNISPIINVTRRKNSSSISVNGAYIYKNQFFGPPFKHCFFCAQRNHLSYVFSFWPDPFVSEKRFCYVCYDKLQLLAKEV